MAVLLGLKSAPRLLINLILLLATLLSNSPLSAQPEPLREELKGLQNQIDSLKEAQEMILRELQEIKRLLKRQGNPPDFPPSNLTISKDSPFMGDKNTKLLLIEFADYQCPFAPDTSARPCLRSRGIMSRQARSRYW